MGIDFPLKTSMIRDLFLREGKISALASLTDMGDEPVPPPLTSTQTGNEWTLSAKTERKKHEAHEGSDHGKARGTVQGAHPARQAHRKGKSGARCLTLRASFVQ